MAYYIYCISLALQLAGALILLSSVSTRRDTIIKSFANKSFISRNGDTKEISDISKECKERFRRAYISREAFLYLTLGYLSEIFAEKGAANRVNTLLIVIVATGILVLMGKMIIDKILLKQKKVNMSVTNDDLERSDIEPDMESMSEEEIDKVFGEAFYEKL